MIDTNKELEWLQDWVNDPADEGTTDLDKRLFTTSEVETIMFIYKDIAVKNLTIPDVMGRFKCNDFAAIEKTQSMCEQSLDPETFEQWEKVKYWLIKNRSVIEWEFKEWAEKATGEAFIIGVDPIGNRYEGTGIMGIGEIVEVKEFEQIENAP